MTKVKYIGLIPARGGSKRIPKKNVHIVNGKPLIYWSIKDALASKYIDKVVVSTDSPEIKSLAIKYGAEVIDRPEVLSGDNLGLGPIMKHTLQKINAKNIVLLRPTSPIRYNGIIDKLIMDFEKYNADSLCSGFINKEVPAFTKEDTPSQKIKGWFQNDGCVEIHRSDIILDNKPYGKRKLKIEIDNIYNYEIDYSLDIIIIEAIMKHIGVES